MTLVEVCVVLVVLGVLAAVFLPALLPIHNGRMRINCVNNLHQIGLAYKSWAGDNNDKFPMEVSVTNGGSMELIADGKNAWLNYLVMSNELSTPKVLICPEDTGRHYATNFSTELVGRISYFVGVNASDEYPLSILSGDDNFAIGGVPVKSGLLELSKNSPVAWTTGRHVSAIGIRTHDEIFGYIGFADGSVQYVTSDGLQLAIQKTGLATNRLAIP